MGDTPTENDSKLAPWVGIDEGRIVELLLEGCSIRDTAEIIGTREDVLRRHFAALIKQTKAERRRNLHKAQTDAALSGDRTLLIWLGKQELGQVDRSEVQQETVAKVVVIHDGEQDTPADEEPTPDA